MLEPILSEQMARVRRLIELKVWPTGLHEKFSLRTAEVWRSGCGSELGPGKRSELDVYCTHPFGLL